MKSKQLPKILGGLFVVAPAILCLAQHNLDAQKQWGNWRGPLSTGVAPFGDPPTEWNENKNVRWKTAIPGKGHSTPIVWGDRIFLTTAEPVGEALTPNGQHAPGAHNNMPARFKQKLMVIAINRRDGTIAWQKTLRTERPHDSTHETGSWASHSPITDGEHLFASFGSLGVYAMDLRGAPIWETDLGDMRTKHGHGEGSSPALHGDTLVINWDHDGQSFVVALDKSTGKRRWKQPRDEGTSWSSPLIVEHQGKPQVIVSATNRVRGYDLTDGRLIWECGGLSGNVVASPVAANGMVHVANSYETRAMLAITLAKAKGDITNTDAVAWTRSKDTPYVPSPVLYDGTLCFLKHYQGVLTCVSAATGDTYFGPKRLPGIQNVYASLVGAANRIYIADRSGSVLVIKRGSSLEILALNRLEDSFSASPAIVDGELFLRGEHHLYCIAKNASDATNSDLDPP